MPNPIVAGRVTNVGRRASDEVVQAYLTPVSRVAHEPLRALAGFERLHLEPGQSRRVELRLRPEAFASVTEQGTREYRPGTYELSLGGGQPLAGVPAVRAPRS